MIRVAIDAAPVLATVPHQWLADHITRKAGKTGRLRLKLKRVVIVGHDIGGHVAYSFARRYPQRAAGIAILDVPIPGSGTWSMTESDPRAWHYQFNQQKPLAEQLTQGHQSELFRYFVDHLAANPKAVTDDDIARFASAYGSPASLTAGFEFYRTFDADKKFNTSNTGRLSTPFLLAGGDHSMGQMLSKEVDDLHLWGIQNIRTAVIANSGHWIAEEQPESTAKVIDEFVQALR